MDNARIENILLDLDTKKEELSEKNAMLKDALENDAEYSELLEEIKELKLKMKGLKEKLIASNDSINEISSDVETLKEDIKDMKSELSDAIEEYKVKTGSRTYETSKGEILTIVEINKLVKRA